MGHERHDSVARLVWLQVRITEEERDLLARGAAAAEGRPSVSAYVRQHMLKLARRDLARNPAPGIASSWPMGRAKA